MLLRKTLLVLGFLLPLAFKGLAQNQLYVGTVRYTDRSLSSYNHICTNQSQVHVKINNVELTNFSTGFFNSGFYLINFDFGTLKVGDIVTVSDDCGSLPASATVQDDYVYVEVPNGLSYSGNGIGSTDSSPPYSRLTTPVNVGKCETVRIGSHGLMDYYIFIDGEIGGNALGEFKIDGVPLASSGYNISNLGLQRVVHYSINADGSVTTDGRLKISSQSRFSGVIPKTLEYQNNGVVLQDPTDFSMGFEALKFRFIKNNSFQIDKASIGGGTVTATFSGSYANSIFKITFDGTYYKAYVDNVQVDALRRFVVYDISGGGISNPGVLDYGTGVTYTPSLTGSQWVGASVDGVLYTRQQFQVADDMSATTTITNAACFGSSTGSIQVNASGGHSPYQYNINGGAFVSSNSFGGLTAGNYTIQVKDASGCTASATATIGQNTSVGLSVTNKSDVTCSSQTNGSVTLQGSGGLAPYSYSSDNSNFNANNSFTGLGEGTYTFWVKDVNGCTQSIANVILGFQSKLIATKSASSTISCYGGNNGSVTISTTGSSPAGAIQFSIDNGSSFQGMGNFSGLAAGNYTVLVKDNLCSTSVTSTLTQPADLLASTSTTHTISCFGGNDGAIQIAASGGVGNYTYSLNDSTYISSNTFGLLAANNYKFWVKDGNGCTKTTTVVALTQPSALTALVSSKTDIFCFGASTGSINLSASGGTAPYTYSIDQINFQNIATFGGLKAGNYTLTIKDNNGCIKTITTQLLQPASTVSATTTINQTVSCFGGNNGQVTVRAAGGTSPYQYSSDGNTYVSGNIFGSLTANIYTFYVKDANGCAITTTATVTQPTDLVPSIISKNDVNCYGGSDGLVQVGGSGGTLPYSYSKDQTNFQSVAAFSNFPIGNYTFSIKDNNGCTKIITSQIQQPTDLGALASVTQNVSCFSGNDGIVTVNGTGGTLPYQFSANGTTYVGSAVFGGLNANTYGYWVKDAHGCIKTTTAVNVTEPTLLVPSVAGKTDVSCFGGNNGTIQLAASGGTAPYVYSTNQKDYQTSTDFSGFFANTYTVSVKDSKGCEKTMTSQILQPSAAFVVTLIAKQNLSCYQNKTGQIQVAGGGGTQAYQFSLDNVNFQTSPIFNNLTATTYTVYGKDVKNCTYSLPEVNLTQPSDIVVNLLEKKDVDCAYYQKGEMLVGAMGSNGNFTYQLGGLDFKNNPVPAASNVTGKFEQLAAGNYTIRAIDGTGCPKDFPVTVISKNTDIRFDINKVLPTTCLASDGQINVINSSGGHPPYQYNISTQSTFSGSGQFNNLMNGSYIITVSDDLCSYKQSVDLSLPGSIKANYTISPISCGIPNANLTVDNITGGSGNYLLAIDGSNFSSNRQFNNLSPDIYAITIQDAPLTCKSVISLEIKEQNRADLQLGSKSDISCFAANNGAINIYGNNNTEPFTYSINNGAFLNNNGIFQNLTIGTYKLTAQNRIGCVDSMFVTLTQPTQLVSSFTQNNNLCYGDKSGNLNVTASGGSTPYIFSVDNTNYQSSGTFTTLTAGDYTIYSKDNHGCVSTQSVTLVQPPDLVPRANVKQHVSCFTGNDGSISVTASGGTLPYAYSANNSDFKENNLFGSLTANNYHYWIKDAHGCTKVTSDLIVTEPPLLVPSIFSTRDVQCFAGSDGIINVAAEGGTPPYQYSTSQQDFQTSATLTGFVIGNYTLFVKDSKGCVKSTTASLNQPTLLTISATVTCNVSCFAGNDGEVVINSSGGTTPYEYSRDLLDFGAGNKFTSLAAHDYLYNVKDAHGCWQKTPIVTVTQPPLLVPSIFSQMNVSCFGGNDGNLQLAATGGTPPYLYANDQINFQETPIYTKFSIGNYSFEVKDGKGCVKTIKTEITQPTELVIKPFYQDTVRCYQEINGSVLIKTLGGTPNYLYSLDGTQYVGDSLFRDLKAGKYTFWAKDNKKCLKKADLEITEPTKLVLSLVNKTDPLCAGEKNGIISVEATGGNKGNTFLLDNIIPQKTGLFANLTQEDYTLKVIDRRGCEDNISSVKLTWPPPLASQLNLVSPRCVGDANGSITIIPNGGVAPYTATLAPIDNSSQLEITKSVAAGSSIFDGIGSGSYNLLLKDQNGCSLLQPAKIIAPDLLKLLKVAADTVVCQGQTVSLDANNPSQDVTWYFNGLSQGTGQTFNAISPGSYSVLVKNKTGCQITKDFKIENSNNALKPDFLMTLQAFVGDTVVVLDITNPKPDELKWLLPDKAYTIDNQATKLSFVIVAPGDYIVELDAKKGDCIGNLKRNLGIFDRKDIDKTNGELHYGEYDIIQTMDVYPNPNYGKFTVTVGLTKVNDAELTITRSGNSSLVYQETKKGLQNYTFDINLKNFMQDVYVITLKAGNSAFVKKILIMN